MPDCTRVGTPMLSSAVLHGQRVHHGRQHAHVVGLGALHAGFDAPLAAPDVAAADDEADLHAQRDRGLHFLGDLVQAGTSMP